MTISPALAGPITLTSLPASVPFAQDPASQTGGFAELLAARVAVGGSAGTSAAARAAPAATAFEEGALFGVATPPASNALSASPQSHIGADSAPPPPLSVGGKVSGAQPGSLHVVTTVQKRAGPPDVYPAEAVESPSTGDVATSARFSFAEAGDRTRPIVTNASPTPEASWSTARTIEPRTTGRPLPASRASAKPMQPAPGRGGPAAIRAATVERLGPVHLSIQIEGSVAQILARVAGTQGDEEDGLERSMRKVAAEMGVEMGVLFLNGAARRPVTRS